MKLNIDSRDKKPNLYPIAFLSAAAAAALAVVYGLPGSPAPGIAGGDPVPVPSGGAGPAAPGLFRAAGV